MANTSIKIQIPYYASQIIKTLRNASYEAFVVGGCVRDALLDKKPLDWDITTSAPPEEVKRLFKRTVDTGIQHGTVTVLMKDESYEVTTYRLDGVYEDSRHPKSVTFTSSIEEDLKRRDFTINAMAYDSEYGLIDLFGGISDLENHIIRCVGNPMERFSEDALRILRALRFSAQLDFTVEEGTTLAMKSLAGTLANISAERIQAELVKMLLSDNPERLRTAYECGLTAVFLPEFDTCMKTPQNHPHHCFSVGEHIIQSLVHSESDRIVRLSLLFHDIGKPLCRTMGDDGFDHFYRHPFKSSELSEEILRRLKFDNNTISKVKRLVLYHDYRSEPTPANVRRLINKVGEDLFSPLLLVMRADILAQSTYKREEKLNHLYNLEETGKKILHNRDCFTIRDLAIGGRDLIENGFKPGKNMGLILERLLDEVMDDPSLNDRDILIERAMALK